MLSNGNVGLTKQVGAQSMSFFHFGNVQFGNTYDLGVPSLVKMTAKCPPTAGTVWNSAGATGARDSHGHGTSYGGGVVRRILRADEAKGVPDATVISVLLGVLQGHYFKVHSCQPLLT